MEIKDHVAAFDWSSRDQSSENTCVCRQCTAQFRSHSKLLMHLAPPVLVSRKPCPMCGSHELSGASYDPEKQVIS